MRTRRIVLGGALALLAALVLWGLLGGGAPQTVTLSDGTRLTLRGVQVGTNCSYNFGNPLQRTAAKLPWKWAKDYALRTTAWNLSSETNLVVWFTANQATEQVGTRRFRFVHVGGTDDLGLQALTRTHTRPEGHWWRFYTAVWPRRSECFMLQAFAPAAPSDAKPLWEWRVRNPLYRDYPQWQPEILPSRRMVEDTVFTLEELVEDSDRLSKELRGQIPPGNSAFARLRMTRWGAPDRDWDVCGVQFRDATGNRVRRIPASTPRTEPGEMHISVPCPFLKGESAGKLSLALVRTRQIDSNEVFVVKSVPLQTTGGAPSTIYYTNALAGRVGVSVAISTTHFGSGTTNVLKEVSVAVDSLEPRVKDIEERGARWFIPLDAKDNLGRTFGFTGYRFDLSNLQRVRLPMDASTVDLTVAAPRVAFLEYAVGRESIRPAPERRRE